LQRINGGVIVVSLRFSYGKEIRGRVKSMCVSDKESEGEWGDKMLEFPAYCLGAGLAGAK